MTAVATEPRAGIKSMTVAKLPQIEKNRAAAEWPYEIGLVKLSELIVDDTYQRPIARELVARMTETFDETLVGCIDVAERKNGSFAVLDGQQRLAAMLGVGKTACYCAVYKQMSLADEAGFFYRKNKDRLSMNAFYAFRARIVAGDQEAKAIQDAVENEGFVLGSATNGREVIGAIRAVETAWGFSSDHREESLTPTLRTIRESIMGRKGATDSSMIQGLGRFWQLVSDDEVQFETLIEVLSDIGPSNLVGLARERYTISAAQRHGASVPWLVARTLVELYNKAAAPRARGKSKARIDTRKFGSS